MSLPNNYDMSNLIPILQSLGVSPENLGPEKLELLQHITDTIDINDTSTITSEKVRKIMDVLGVSKKDKQRQINFKVGRNENCPCGSMKKYKKCCGIASSFKADGQ